MARLGIWRKFVGAQGGTTRNLLEENGLPCETVKDSPEEGDLYVIRSSPKQQPYKMDVEVNG